MSLSHVQEHIELIAKHEMEFLAQRTRAERFADSVAEFIGSLQFVGVNFLIYAAWIVMNSVVPVHHFDPRPFSLRSLRPPRLQLVFAPSLSATYPPWLP